MDYIQPSFGLGYARNAGMALYPHLWQSLIGYWSPALGISPTPVGSQNLASLPELTGNWKTPKAVLGNIPSYINGAQFRCLLTNGNGTTTSAVATVVGQPFPALTQPVNSTVNINTTTTFTVAVTGGFLNTYLWYQSTNGGVTWTPTATTSATYTTATTTAAMNGYQYYCYVTNSTGSVNSNIVTLNVVTNPYFTTQPVSQTITTPSTANFTVQVLGTVSTYQWQVSTNTGLTWTNVSTGTGGTTASYTTPATTLGMNGYLYQCYVTNTYGSAISNPVILTTTSVPYISTQPQSALVTSPLTTSFTVASSGTITGYQWQVSVNGGAFGNISNNSVYSGATTATLTVIQNTSLNGNQYKCVVTNAAGSTASNPATLTILPSFYISQQPANYMTQYDGISTATFTIGVIGSVVSYQWQVNTNTGLGWTNISGANAASYTTGTVNNGNQGTQYQCIVSNGTTTLTSNAATLVTAPSNPPSYNGYTYPGITSQTVGPLVVNAPATATMSVTSNVNNTFTWQYSINGGSTWTNCGAGQGSGFSTNTFTTVATSAALNGYQYRCEVSGNSNTQIASPVTLVVVSDPIITTQPTSPALVTAPSAVTLTVVSYGNNLYQWQVSTNGGSTWANVVGFGATTATLILNNTTASMNGNLYQCVITNASAPSSFVVSNPVTLLVQNVPTITAQTGLVQLTGGNGTTLSVTAPAAPGITYTYQWYSNNNGFTGTVWTLIAGQTNSTYTFTPAVNGAMYYCTVTDPSGTVNSNIICVTTTTGVSGITTEPVTQTIVASPSGTATFSVTATVSPTAYQWYMSPVLGSTTAASIKWYTCQTLYNFQISAISGTPVAGNVYTNNGQSFTVITVNLTGGVGTVVTSGTGAPTASGTLTNGGNTMTFTSDTVYSNSTTSSMTTPAITDLTMNGYFYICAVTNASGVTTTLPAVLTVQNNALLTTQPSASAVITPGATTTFAVVAGANTPTPTYQWQLSPNNGSFYNTQTVYNFVITSMSGPNPVVGGTFTNNSITYTILGVNIYQGTGTGTVIATGSGAPTAGPSTLVGSGASTGTSLNYTATATTCSGNTGATLTTCNTDIEMNGWMFNCVVGDANTSNTTSNVAVLTVQIINPYITTQPVNTTVTLPIAPVFSVVASGTNTYQWLLSANSGTNWYPTNNVYNFSITAVSGTAPMVGVTWTNGGHNFLILAVSLVSGVGTLIAYGTSAPSAGPSTLANGGNTASYTASATTYTNSTTATLTGPVSIALMSGFEYQCEITETASSGITLSNAVTLTTQANPYITTNPVSTSVPAPLVAQFSVVSPNAVSYQWQVNVGAGFTNIIGATSQLFTTPVLVTAMNGNLYRCLVTNTFGTTTSSIAVLNFAMAGNAVISTQSTTSPTVTAPSTQAFTIAVTGGSPTYQWQYSLNQGNNWAIITTTNTYFFTITTTAGTVPSAGMIYTNNAHSFTVVATNLTPISGNPLAYSGVIMCSATGAPSGTSLVSGTSTATFSANTVFATPTTATLTTPATNIIMNGLMFECVVTNSATTNVSTPSTLNVQSSSYFTTQPVSSAVAGNATTTFGTVAASGSSPTYQWYVNPGNGNWYFTNQVYRFTVTSYTGTLPTVNSTYTNNSQTFTILGIDICANGTGFVTAQAAGAPTATGTLTGTVSGTIVYSAEATNTNSTTATLTTTSTDPSMNGWQYQVVAGVTVSGSPVYTYSNVVTLTTIFNNFSIGTQPSNLTVTVGATAAFAVVANSVYSVTYQWYQNTGSGWFVITGATSASYTTPATSNIYNGFQYQCVVSNATMGVSLTTTPVTLTISTNPVFVTNLATTATYGIGATPVLTIAGDTVPTAYQWFSNPGTGWVTVSGGSGANTAAYTLPALTLANSGIQYQCVMYLNLYTFTISSSVGSNVWTFTITGVSGSDPAPGQSFTNNSATFIVQSYGTYSLVSHTGTIICTSAGTPTASGTLTNGGNTATFSASSTYFDPVIGSTYTNNGFSFVVQSYGTYSTSTHTGTIICSGTGTPLSSGTLTDGSLTAAFSAFTSTTSGELASNILTITVPATPYISTQPVSITTTAPSSAAPTLVVSGTAPTFQWQISNDGGVTWSNFILLYQFSITAITGTFPTAGTVYTNNSQSFTVSSVWNFNGPLGANVGTVICTATGAPAASGTLTSGANTMTFSGQASVGGSGQTTATFTLGNTYLSPYVPLGKDGYALNMWPTSNNSRGIGLGNTPYAMTNWTLTFWALSYVPMISGFIVAQLNTSWEFTNNGSPLEIANNGGTIMNMYPPYSIWNGQWHHIAMVMNASNNIMQCYIDGINFEPASTSVGTIGAGTPLNLFVSNYAGLVGDIGVWNRCLSGFDIATLCGKGSPMQLAANADATAGAALALSTGVNIVAGGPSLGTGNIPSVTPLLLSSTLVPQTISNNWTYQAMTLNLTGTVQKQAYAATTFLHTFPTLFLTATLIKPNPMIITFPGKLNLTTTLKQPVAHITATTVKPSTFHLGLTLQAPGTLVVNPIVVSPTTLSLAATLFTPNEGEAFFRTQNGNQITAFIQGVSATGTLNVMANPWVTTQPNSLVATSSTTGTSSFTVATTAASPSYVWQVSADGINFFNASTIYFANVNSTTGTVPGVGAIYTNNGHTYTVIATPGITGTGTGIYVLTGNGTPTTGSATLTGSGFTGTAVYSATPLVFATPTGATLTTPVTAVGAVLMSGLVLTVQCLVTNSAGTTTSNTATWTVQTAPYIVTQPPSTLTATIGAGLTAVFSVVVTTAGGTPTTTYQWQYSSNGGVTWTNVDASHPAAGWTNYTTATMTSQALSSNTYNQYLFRCQVTANSTTINTNQCLLLLQTLPYITTQPVPYLATAPSDPTYTVAALGVITGYQWQVSTNGGTSFSNITTGGTPGYTGYTTATLGITTTATSMNGYLYQCVVTNAAGTTTSNAAVLGCVGTPILKTQPAPVFVSAGSTTSFTIVASGSSLSYQWQVSTNGGASFANVSASVPASGFTNYTTATLSVPATLTAWNGYLFQCIVTNGVGSTSSQRSLIVVPALQTLTGTVPTPSVNSTFSATALSIVASVFAPSIGIFATYTPTTLQLAASVFPLTLRLTNGSNKTVLDALHPNHLSLTLTQEPPTKYKYSYVFSAPTLQLSASQQEPAVTSTNIGTFSNGTCIAFIPNTFTGLNELVIATNQNPLQYAIVNINTPASPTYIKYNKPGAGVAVAATYDTVNNEIFIACQTGAVVEINPLTHISLVVPVTPMGNINSMARINSLDETYLGTDYGSGEVLSMYEGFAPTVGIDIRFAATVVANLGMKVNTVQAATFATDIRWAGTVNDVLGCDIRFIDSAFADLSITPIARTDAHVYIGGTEVTDIQLDSIEITHTVDNKSEATFILSRHHDNVDYVLNPDGSQGTHIPVTGNPAVQIIIDGNEEFGYNTPAYVWDIDTKSDTETVKITAYSELPQQDDRSGITLSIPGLNEKLHIYHALVNNPTIDDPYILADDPNPPFYLGVLIDLGYKRVQNVTQFQGFSTVGQTEDQFVNYVFGSGDSGVYDVNGNNVYFKPYQNWTYFWFGHATNFITGQTWSGLLNNGSSYLGTSPSSLTSQSWDVDYINFWYQRVFPDSVTRLGSATVYPSDFIGVQAGHFDAALGLSGFSGDTNVDAILRNHTAYTFTGAQIQSYKTTLAVLTNPGSSLTTINGVNYLVTLTGELVPVQLNMSTNILDIIDSKCGQTFGSAPFKKVSSKNGILQTATKWEDAPNGLFYHKEQGYDYTAYINALGAIELQKLQNINGSVLPKTKADIEIFLDGYYHYNIALLKRINIDNTVQANIYNGNNGFPVSVKTIHISLKNMRVTLTCDNQWSRLELLELESHIPDPWNSLTPETIIEYSPKFDPNSLQDIE